MTRQSVNTKSFTGSTINSAPPRNKAPSIIPTDAASSTSADGEGDTVTSSDTASTATATSTPS